MDHDTPAGMLDSLSTPLKHWQISGAIGLVELAQSQFKGGILGDSMGLGKSSTALVAALELRKRLLPNHDFISIVCRAGCVLQWAKEQASRSPSTTTFDTLLTSISQGLPSNPLYILRRGSQKFRMRLT